MQKKSLTPDETAPATTANLVDKRRIIRLIRPSRLHDRGVK